MTSFTIQKILVPTDLSHTSLNALNTAVALARKHYASIYLLHIAEPDFSHLTEENDTHPDPLSGSSDVLAALAGTIEYANGLNPEIIRAEGNVAEAIIKHSLSCPADLIVMGTHGASGYRDGFIGSNTYRVIKHSSCPVLTVPAIRKYESFQRVLYPIRPVQGALMRYDIASHFLASRPTMDVLGLSYGNMERGTNILDTIIEEVKEQLVFHKTNVKPVWGAGLSVAEDVLKYAQQTHPDLLIVTSLLDVISKPGFIGPHTQKIINCSKIPVLNIKKLGVPAFS